MRKQIKPAQVVGLIDTREQQPLDLSPMQSETATLQTGDYSVRGCEDIIRVERKSLPDLLGCVGRDRDRFEREIERLIAFPVAVIVVEASWAEIETGDWRSKVKPNAVIGSLLGWQARGISIHLVDDHARASKHVSRLLFTVARRQWQRLHQMGSAMRETEAPP